MGVGPGSIKTSLTTKSQRIIKALLAVAFVAASAIASADIVVRSLEPPVALSGTWKFHTGDNPEFANPHFDDHEWSNIQVPLPWGRQGYKSYSGVAWYRLHLQLLLAPDIARDLQPGITMGTVDSSYEIYAGGIKLGQVGALPPSPKMEYDRIQTYSIPTRALDNSGNLVIAVRVWKSPGKDKNLGGLYHEAFLIGRIEDLTRRELLIQLPNLVLAFLFILVGLYHFQLFRRRPELKEYFWFGLLSFFNSGIYTFLRSQWKYQLGDHFLLYKEIEYVCLFTSPAILLQFLFPLLDRKVGKVLRGYQFFCIVLAVICPLEPGLRLNLFVLPWFEYSMIVVALWSMYIVFGDAIRGNPQARTIAIGLSLLLVTVVNDVVDDRAWWVTPRLMTYGYFLFILSMALSLANRFTRVYGEVDQLRRNLEERVEERTQQLSEANEQLSQRTRELAEVSHAKSQFLANMSHELRTPLNAIIGYSEMLQEMAQDEQQPDFIPDLQKIRSAGKHLLLLINDILDLSKIEAGKMEIHVERVEITGLIRDVTETIKPLIEKNSNRLITDTNAAPLSVQADSFRLKQVLLNLLSNASKFTSGGNITLQVLHQNQNGNAWVLFRIIDTGIGMNQEQLAKLFQPFTQADSSTTRKFGGTGLGLTISKKFCEMMEGDLTATSEEGAGSVFTARLPAE